MEPIGIALVGGGIFAKMEHMVSPTPKFKKQKLRGCSLES
jgi:hypothetical protein